METCGRYSGLILSVLDSGLGVWVQDLAGHCAVFLCKTLSSHSASLNPGVFSGKPDKMIGGGGALLMDLHPIQGEVVILLVTSCYGK